MAGDISHHSQSHSPDSPELPFPLNFSNPSLDQTAQHPPKPLPPRRQSSFAQPRPNGAPRTPNRVRFEVEDPPAVNGHARPPLITEDGSGHNDDDSDYSPGAGDSPRLPLLTGIEAPSVTVAQDADFNAEDHVEGARPQSGMRSAFMNMANSIMYVVSDPLLHRLFSSADLCILVGPASSANHTLFARPV